MSAALQEDFGLVDKGEPTATVPLATQLNLGIWLKLAVALSILASLPLAYALGVVLGIYSDMLSKAVEPVLATLVPAPARAAVEVGETVASAVATTSPLDSTPRELYTAAAMCFLIIGSTAFAVAWSHASIAVVCRLLLVMGFIITLATTQLQQDYGISSLGTLFVLGWLGLLNEVNEVSKAGETDLPTFLSLCLLNLFGARVVITDNTAIADESSTGVQPASSLPQADHPPTTDEDSFASPHASTVPAADSPSPSSPPPSEPLFLGIILLSPGLFSPTAASRASHASDNSPVTPAAARKPAASTTPDDKKEEAAEEEEEKQRTVGGQSESATEGVAIEEKSTVQCAEEEETTEEENRQEPTDKVEEATLWDGFMSMLRGTLPSADESPVTRQDRIEREVFD